MAEETMVMITMLRGEFIHPAWREEGTVHEVEQRIADRWIAHGSAKLGNEPFARLASESHELGDFPSAALFAAAGYGTLDQIKALIAEKGDAWPKSVKGMTKALAAKVSEFLEAQAKQSEETKGDTTEGGSPE